MLPFPPDSATYWCCYYNINLLLHSMSAFPFLCRVGRCLKSPFRLDADGKSTRSFALNPIWHPGQQGRPASGAHVTQAGSGPTYINHASAIDLSRYQEPDPHVRSRASLLLLLPRPPVILLAPGSWYPTIAFGHPCVLASRPLSSSSTRSTLQYRLLGHSSLHTFRES